MVVMEMEAVGITRIAEETIQGITAHIAIILMAAVLIPAGEIAVVAMVAVVVVIDFDYT